MPKRDKRLYLEDILDRNFIIHEYFGIDAQIVWDLTTQDLDELVDHIKKIEGSK